MILLESYFLANNIENMVDSNMTLTPTHSKSQKRIAETAPIDSNYMQHVEDFIKTLKPDCECIIESSRHQFVLNTKEEMKEVGCCRTSVSSRPDEDLADPFRIEDDFLTFELAKIEQQLDEVEEFLRCLVQAENSRRENYRSTRQKIYEMDKKWLQHEVECKIRTAEQILEIERKRQESIVSIRGSESFP